jgi:hypothetical protein
MKNWKYYLLYPIILPFILLDKVIFFEIEASRFWDDSIWLHRLLLWHDSFYAYDDGTYSFDYDSEIENLPTGEEMLARNRKGFH